jgi:predicted Zn-dependent protease
MHIIDYSEDKNDKYPLYKRIIFSVLMKGMVIALILVVIAISNIFFQAVKAYIPTDNINKKPQYQQHSIKVCCSWGEKLAHGILTYKIIGGDEVAQQAVRNAIKQWNIKLKSIEIIEVSEGNINADIEVIFNSKAQKIDNGVSVVASTAGHIIRNAVTAGQSINNFDENGFITNVQIIISRSAFGNTFSSNKIEQLTEHEIGHALGLGHTNFNDDLMSVIVNDKTGSISKCDINAVLKANEWKLLDSSSTPYNPQVDHVYC